MKKIPLTQGKFALVDDADYEFLMQWKWFVMKDSAGNRVRWYAARCDRSNGGKRTLRMHREILGVNDSKVIVDHINQDTLNNCRSNLRLCKANQNAHNASAKLNGSSKYKGVSLYHKKPTWTVKWAAQITLNYKHIHLGYFLTQEEAARAYDARAKELFGEFARLNFPEEKAA